MFGNQPLERFEIFDAQPPSLNYLGSKHSRLLSASFCRKPAKIESQQKKFKTARPIALSRYAAGSALCAHFSPGGREKCWLANRYLAVRSLAIRFFRPGNQF